MKPTEKACSVSIIVPAYNAESYLEETLNSIMAQDMLDYETLVVNDGSTDGTARILDRYKDDARLKILTHPGGENRGQCASTRLALEKATGEFVALLDADDQYLPEKLTRHTGLLRQRPGVVLVHGNVEWKGPIPDHPGMRLMFRLEGGAREYTLSEDPIFLRSNMICNSTVVCRRTSIDLARYPVSMMFQYQDWVLWNLLAERGSFYFDDQPLTIYRYHSQGFTFKNSTQSGAAHLAHIEFYCLMLTRLASPLHRHLCAKYLLNNLVTLVAVKAESAGGSKESPVYSLQFGATRTLVVPLLLLIVRLGFLSVSWLRALAQRISR